MIRRAIHHLSRICTRNDLAIDFPKMLLEDRTDWSSLESTVDGSGRIAAVPVTVDKRHRQQRWMDLITPSPFSSPHRLPSAGVSEVPDGVQRPLVVAEQCDRARLQFTRIRFHDRQLGTGNVGEQFDQGLDTIGGHFGIVMGSGQPAIEIRSSSISCPGERMMMDLTPRTRPPSPSDLPDVWGPRGWRPEPWLPT